MSAILNKTTIKNYDSNLSFDAMIKHSPLDLVHFNDLMSLTNTIIEYFSNNISKSPDNKLLLQTTSGNKHKVSLNLTVAFGLKLSKISGNRVTDKFKKLLNNNYLFKKLKELKQIYKEVYFLSKSNYSYVTDIALSNYKKKTEFYNRAINKSTLLSNSGVITPFKMHYYSKKAQHTEYCHTSEEVKELAIKTNKYWLSATITCPSNFHINPKNKRKSWDNASTPLDANDFQNEIWENTLRKLAKIDVNPFGQWTKEANKSGALHRHLLVYACENELNITKKWLIHYTKKSYKKFIKNFTKWAIHFDSDSCDNSVKLNKTVNYLNKTLKNNNKKSSVDESEKIEAHAQLYKYRRYGFFGLQKSLSHWRLLKQFVHLKNVVKAPKKLQELLVYANNNEFHKFLLSPFKNLITKVVEQCSYARDKVVGFAYKGKEFIFKQRYFDFYEQILNNFSLRILFDIKKINVSSLSTS
jgi:hypothetical protein